MEHDYPLTGLRVVDLSTGIPGGYCSKLLADAGADVIKVEPPAGDTLRRPQRRRAVRILEHIQTRHRARSGRRSHDDDRATLLALYATADLVIESFEPGEIESLDLGVDALESCQSPRATMLSISNFGRGGPWTNRPASEFTLLAQAGSTATRGFPGGRSSTPAVVSATGWAASTPAVAALAALRRRAIVRPRRSRRSLAARSGHADVHQRAEPLRIDERHVRARPRARDPFDRTDQGRLRRLLYLHRATMDRLLRADRAARTRRRSRSREHRRPHRERRSASSHSCTNSPPRTRRKKWSRSPPCCASRSRRSATARTSRRWITSSSAGCSRRTPAAGSCSRGSRIASPAIRRDRSPPRPSVGQHEPRDPQRTRPRPTGRRAADDRRPGDRHARRRVATRRCPCGRHDRLLGGAVRHVHARVSRRRRDPRRVGTTTRRHALRLGATTIGRRVVGVGTHVPLRQRRQAFDHTRSHP